MTRRSQTSSWLAALLFAAGLACGGAEPSAATATSKPKRAHRCQAKGECDQVIAGWVWDRGRCVELTTSGCGLEDAKDPQDSCQVFGSREQCEEGQY